MGTITVSLATWTALWSDGPAPPARLSPGPRGSSQRSPKAWSSETSSGRSAGRRAVGRIGSDRFMDGISGKSGQRGGGGSVVRVRVRTAVDEERKELGPRVVPDAVHHSLAL